jgi:Uma2 family endonuclease
VGHQRINVRLVSWLEHHVPAGFEALMALGVLIDVDTTREPDAMIVHSPADLNHHFCKAEEVLVAVEFVSPGTRRRVRFEKPALYASAGIPHYWRIEQNPVHVFAYDLVGGAYELAADSTDELVLNEPFELRLPIREITP